MGGLRSVSNRLQSISSSGVKVVVGVGGDVSVGRVVTDGVGIATRVDVPVAEGRDFSSVELLAGDGDLCADVWAVSLIEGFWQADKAIRANNSGKRTLFIQISPVKFRGAKSNSIYLFAV